MDNIKIKQNWFELIDDNNDNNKFIEIGYEGLYLYFSMFKFRLYKQEHNYMFITSISLLRKETGYASDIILTLLKLLKKKGILKFDGLSRWDILLDENKKIKDKEVIVCYASDVPILNMVSDNGKEKEAPSTLDDYYINVDLNMLQYYSDIGLNERFIPIYCMMRGWNDTNTEGKSFVGVEKMAATLGYDKDTLNKMIHTMNRKYVLASYYKDNKKEGEYFEHRICFSLSLIHHYRDSGHLKDQIDKNIKKWDKRKEKKARVRNKVKKEIEK
jgi:hypothetical protein